MISAERHFDGIINQFGSVKPCVVIGAKIQVDTSGYEVWWYNATK